MKKFKDGELDKYKSEDENEYFYKLVALWQKSSKNFTREYEELTEQEKEKYNKSLISELETE